MMSQPIPTRINTDKEHDGELFISQRTIRANDRVLQTQNVSSFGPGAVPRYWYKYRQTAALALLGFILLPWNGLTKTFGLIIIIVAVVAAFAKHRNPHRYGLLVTMNSGENIFFQTNDRNGLVRITAHVASLIESMEKSETTTKVKVSTKKVSFENVNVEGIFNTGTMSGDASVHTSTPREDEGATNDEKPLS